MAKLYAPDVDEAIYALMCEDVPLREIVRRLKDDEAGLGRVVDMPRRTVQDHMRRLREARGVPVKTIKPGEEIDAAREIKRRLLELTEKETKKLEQASAAANGVLSSPQLEQLRKLLKTVDEVTQRDAMRRSPSQPRRAAAERAVRGGGFLAELQRKERDNG